MSDQRQWELGLDCKQQYGTTQVKRLPTVEQGSLSHIEVIEYEDTLHNHEELDALMIASRQPLNALLGT